jgi:hypothetical protein
MGGCAALLRRRHRESFVDGATRFSIVTFSRTTPGIRAGITLRQAPQPWGPWSAARTIFDPGWGSAPNQPVGIGYGTFMHIPWNVAHVDNVQDDGFFVGSTRQ